MKSFRWIFVALIAAMVLWWPRSSSVSPATGTLSETTGNTMPRIGLGTWKAGKGVVGNAVKHALLNGYKHIDMAPRYGNEKEIGEVFNEVFKTRERKEFFLGSKLWNTDHHPSQVSDALTRTLTDLQLTYLDTWYMHWPVSLKQGGDVYPDIVFDSIPIEDTWAAMEKEYDVGRVRSLAVSNFNVEQLQSLLKVARIKPKYNQIELHPYLPNGRLVRFCKQHGIQVVAFSPIGSPGNAANNRKDVIPLIQNPVITQIAERVGRTPAQVVLKWGLQKGVVVIPKSVTPSRVDENLAAGSLPDLSEDDVFQIDRLPQVPTRYVSSPHFWNGVTEADFWKDDGAESIN
eukprot:TRINITY_DN21061_c0_g1_i1.p1 TRINITY_DN21061_c0_g1~~TRINITY_DN21061_c0_g1_i1.p1  ORF type:complete len:345 (+),score=72.01 TRINITY_DN21061_c0_g1_i1:56-1090(+)